MVGWLLLTSGPRVTRARFEQVKEGMSRQEVIRTVGGPPGDYSARRAELGHSTDYDRWLCDDAALVVYFNDAGIVTETAILDLPPPRLTLAEKIRRFLGF
jgi:hypothetical protein